MWRAIKKNPLPKTLRLVCAVLRSAAWWRPALRCRRITIRRFLTENPGLVLIRRTPAAGLSSAASFRRHGVTQTRKFVHTQASVACSSRAAELLSGAPVSKCGGDLESAAGSRIGPETLSAALRE